MIKLKNILNETVEYYSPSGGKIIYYFESGQGSKYLFTTKGESKRWKSSHANTGDEDMGLKEWYKKCVFVDPKNEYEANCFQFMDKQLRKNVALSVDDKKGVFYINDGGKWRVATFNDAYPKFTKNNPDKKDKQLIFSLTKEPKIGYNVLEFNLKTNGIIEDLHFGSPVSKIVRIEKVDTDDLLVFNI